jgi:hypothetical protein
MHLTYTFWWLSNGLCVSLKLHGNGVFDCMAFGRAWQHAKYSYGAWQSFAHNSENFQQSSKIEKCVIP